MTKVISDKEARFIADLLDVSGELWGNRSCEEMSESTRDLFSDAQKDDMMKAYHGWNGDPEDYIEGYFSPQLSLWMHFFAAKLRGEV